MHRLVVCDYVLHFLTSVYIYKVNDFLSSTEENFSQETVQPLAHLNHWGKTGCCRSRHQIKQINIETMLSV